MNLHLIPRHDYPIIIVCNPLVHGISFTVLKRFETNPSLDEHFRTILVTTEKYETFQLHNSSVLYATNYTKPATMRSNT